MEEDEEEWVAADWAQVANADVHNADIPYPIKSACRAISRPARSAGLKW